MYYSSSYLMNGLYCTQVWRKIQWIWESVQFVKFTMKSDIVHFKHLGSRLQLPKYCSKMFTEINLAPLSKTSHYQVNSSLVVTRKNCDAFWSSADRKKMSLSLNFPLVYILYFIVYKWKITISFLWEILIYSISSDNFDLGKGIDLSSHLTAGYDTCYTRSVHKQRLKPLWHWHSQ